MRFDRLLICLVIAVQTGGDAMAAPDNSCRDTCAFNFIVDTLVCSVTSLRCGLEYWFCDDICSAGAVVKLGNCVRKCDKGGSISSPGVGGVVDDDGRVSLFALSDVDWDSMHTVRFYLLNLDDISEEFVDSKPAIDTLPWIPVGPATFDERDRMWRAGAQRESFHSVRGFVVRADFDTGDRAYGSAKVAGNSGQRNIGRNAVGISAGWSQTGEISSASTPPQSTGDVTVYGIYFTRRLSRQMTIELSWNRLLFSSKAQDSTCGGCQSSLNAAEVIVQWQMGDSNWSVAAGSGWVTGSLRTIDRAGREERDSVDGTTHYLGGSWRKSFGRHLSLHPGAGLRLVQAGGYPNAGYRSLDPELHLAIETSF